jgi:hypothetical protein
MQTPGQLEPAHDGNPRQQLALHLARDGDLALQGLSSRAARKFASSWRRIAS